MKINYYEHQQKIIDESPDKVGLFWGCGTGKTLTAIKLAEKKKCNALVICPKSLKENWKREIDRFGDGIIEWKIISKEEFKKYAMELPKYNTVIWDEAHYASGLKSQIHKITYKYITYWKVEHFYLLTATPYMANCWSVFALGKLLGHDWKWHHWNRTFFYEIRLGKKPEPGKPDRRRRISKQKNGIENKIAEIVNRIGVTARIEDLFDVPEQVFLDEFFDLTSEQKKAMENVVETHPVVEFTKYHQICGGSLKGDGYTEDQFFKCDKLDRLLELIKENKKIMVICSYNNEIQYIEKKIRSKYKDKQIFIINGAIKDKDMVVQAAENVREGVVLANSKCSEGYNLPSIPIMIFYSLDFSLKNYIQILGRIQRGDHIKKNIYIHMTTKNSIDTDVYKCMINKEEFHIKIYAYKKREEKIRDGV